jgi:hypothetical protein
MSNEVFDFKKALEDLKKGWCGIKIMEKTLW